MRVWPIVFWLVIGGMLGFGMLGILSIGMPFLFAGLVLAVVGAVRFRTNGLWALLVGFGVVPTVILIYDLVHVLPAYCAPNAATLTGLSATDAARVCADMPSTRGTFTAMAVLYTAIALAGAGWAAYKHQRGMRQVSPEALPA